MQFQLYSNQQFFIFLKHMLSYETVHPSIYDKYRNTGSKWKVTNIKNEVFQIYEQYEIIDFIGESEIGMVVVAIDKENDNCPVAITKQKHIFQHQIFVRKILKEIRMLRLLKHQNILNIKTIMLPKSHLEFQDLYIVFQMADTDLSQVIRHQQIPTQDHRKFILYQILRGLKYIHSAQIAHRNIKPGNIMLNTNCDVKINGFRLAFYKFKKERARNLTQEVPARWYSSPQILLNNNFNHQNESVDMWSVGCVFAEMLLGRPFIHGNDSKNQVQLMCNYFSEEIPYMSNIGAWTRQSIKEILDKKPRLKDIRQQFSFADPKAVDLLKRFLTVDPQKRITVLEALKHPYLQDLHLEEDEPTAEQVNCLEFEFQDHNLNTEQLKDLLYEQILLYHFKDFAKEYESKKANNQSLIKHILQK